MKPVLNVDAPFEFVSVILPVMDETESLVQTVDAIAADCDADVHEYLVVVGDRTRPESLAVCDKLAERIGERFRRLHQTRPFLGGAMRDAFAAARGSHVLMMSSDLETPPEKVKDFIAEARRRPDALITASRWIEGGGFEGYNPLKYLLNFVFQKFFGILYRTRLTDITYGYRLFPRRLVQAIRWEELRHPFLMETLIKPLRLGVPVIEIPCPWQRRQEGESSNTFWRNFSYFRIGLKTLCYAPDRMLIAEEPSEQGGA